MPSENTLQALSGVVAQGLPGPQDGVKPLLNELFGSRYTKNDLKKVAFRDAYGLASDESSGVPYAGLTNPDNPPSGPYGGASLVWFPGEQGSLVSFVVGTRGLSPDEGILTRPGHRRRIRALRRYLARKGIQTWVKPDPAALTEAVPRSVQREHSSFQNVFSRYGKEIYCLAWAKDAASASVVLPAFLDVYAFERGWSVLRNAETGYHQFLSELRNDLFETTSAEKTNELLRARRFVILQGPPGTGKTRLADEIRRQYFNGKGMTVQFHPAVTYEDFMVGLSPDATDRNLRFDVRLGWLLQAAQEARNEPFLLTIDEVNRADLGKVMGEAIYLFEPDQVGGPNAREVALAHPVNGQRRFRMPENLHVIATMNTADRSIASIDLAIRRRFAFIYMPPERTVIARQELSLAVEVFDRVSDVFVEHALDEALDLLPGHAYFLAKDETELKRRMRYELLPLLNEYLREGYLGPASAELHAVRDWIEDTLQHV